MHIHITRCQIKLFSTLCRLLLMLHLLLASFYFPFFTKRYPLLRRRRGRSTPPPSTSASPSAHTSATSSSPSASSAILYRPLHMRLSLSLRLNRPGLMHLHQPNSRSEIRSSRRLRRLHNRRLGRTGHPAPLSREGLDRQMRSARRHNVRHPSFLRLLLSGHDPLLTGKDRSEVVLVLLLLAGARGDILMRRNGRGPDTSGGVAVPHPAVDGGGLPSGVREDLNGPGRGVGGPVVLHLDSRLGSELRLEWRTVANRGRLRLLSDGELRSGEVQAGREVDGGATVVRASVLSASP